MADVNVEYKELTIENRTFTIGTDGSIVEKGKKLRQYENTDGYLVVNAKKDRWIGVHRMVAMTFIHNDDPVNKEEVNHLDFNRKNNRVDNLKWVTHEENIKYSAEHGRYIGKFGVDNPNYGNRKLSKFYKENPDVALKKQSRKAEKNGRARKIELYQRDTLIATFNYIGECCTYLHKYHGFSSDVEVVRSGIRTSILYDRPYKGFKFKKI